MTNEEFQEVINFLEETPERIHQLASQMAGPNLKWKPSDDDFSVVEQICHLRDIEREGYSVRIRKILTESEPSLPDIDGSRLARERVYNSQNKDKSASYELPLRGLSKDVSQYVEAVTFTPPPDFGPTNF